jgi:putative tricarboxylic transport membrane protein
MSSLEAFYQGLQIIANPSVLLTITAGTLVAIVLGILPGINAGFALIVILPFILGADPKLVLPLMICFCSVGPTGGSVTAVLTGIPGDTANAATVLDGFPMTRRGEGGRGVGAALMSSTMGAITTVMMAIIMMPVLIPIVMAFKSPEMFLLIAMGLCFLSVVTKGSRLKGLISASLGILISTIGFQTSTGEPRFTLGSVYLYDGVEIVVIVMGLFAMPVLLELATSEQTILLPGKEMQAGYRGMLQGARDVFQHWWLFLRCTLIGYIVGVIPGIGGETAIWASLAHAKQTSKHPETFGTGNIEGVIGPQSAENSKVAGDLLTTLAFGIPGSGIMVFVLAGMILVGIQPGPKMLTEHAGLSFSLLQTVALSNIMAGTVCFIFAPYLVRLTKVSSLYLFCFITPLVLISVYARNLVATDMLLLLATCGIGVCLDKYGYIKPALVLGFILGRLFESYLFLSMNLFGPLFIFSSPISCILVLCVIGLLAQDPLKMLWARFRKTSDTHVSKEGLPKKGRNPYFLLGIMVFALLFFVGALAYSNAKMSSVPLMASGIILLLGAIQLREEFRVPGKARHDTQMIDESNLSEEGERWQYPIVFVWWVSFVLVTYLFGFLVAIPLLPLSFVRFRGHRGWLKSIAVAATAEASIYVIFVAIMQIDLYRGILLGG